MTSTSSPGLNRSTVSVCPLKEVADQSPNPIWFQLYVLKDRGFMADVLQRAKALGAATLVYMWLEYVRFSQRQAEAAAAASAALQARGA